MSLMVGHKRPRKRSPRRKDGPPTGNTPADAAVEAQQRASGILVDADPRKLSDEELERRRTEQAIAADPSLLFRPMNRLLNHMLSTRKVRNLNGTPVLGAGGQPIVGSQIEAVVDSAVLAAINPGDPNQQACRELIWYGYFGKPRESFELSGPEGGPIQSQAIPAIASMSDDELASKFMRVMNILTAVQKRQESPPVIEAVPVSSTPIPTAAPATAVDVQASAIVVPAAPSTAMRPANLPPPLAPAPAAKSQPAKPVVGGIPVTNR